MGTHGLLDVTSVTSNVLVIFVACAWGRVTMSFSARSPLASSPLSTRTSDSLVGEITESHDAGPNMLRSERPTPASSVNLDGFDWFLTVMLVTVDALLVELHRTSNTKWSTLLTWVTKPDFDEDWSGKLCETLFLLAIAVVNVMILVPIVNINLRAPSIKSWRFWLLSSWASLGLLNVMTGMQLADSIMKAQNDEDVKYWISHFFLVGMIVITTLALDLRFVMLYGFCSCFTCCQDTTIANWSGLRAIGGIRGKVDRVRLRDILNIRRIVHRSMHTAERLHWRKSHRATFKFAKTAQQGVERFLRRRRLQKLRHLLSHRTTEQITDLPSEDVSQYLNEVMQSNANFVFNITRQKLLAWWDAISEEPGFFVYSAWMKAAVSFTILIVTYNCIRAMEIIFRFQSTWDMGHNVAIELQSGLNHVDQMAREMQSSIEETGTTLAPVYENLTSEVQSLNASLSSFLPQDMDETPAYQRASAMLHLILVRASQMIKNSNFDADKVLSAFFYMDSLVGWLKYACIVGYPLGTMVGFISLYQVMKQHKEMSMGLSREEQVRAHTVVGKVGIHRTRIRDTLMGLEEKYPVGGAVYFIGVLASTAVVQQHIFGICSTLVIAIFLNIAKFDVLLNCGGYIVLIYTAIIASNFFWSHIIGDYLLTNKGFKIRYPVLFFIFLFGFTIIHAVLGFFYALWRALLLFVTTVWVVNRLDISLFQTGKRLDNGHYSFMSMLLLTHVIRLENEARVREGDPIAPLQHASESTAEALLSQRTLGANA